jgi:hypothetical protein
MPKLLSQINRYTVEMKPWPEENVLNEILISITLRKEKRPYVQEFPTIPRGESVNTEVLGNASHTCTCIHTQLQEKPLSNERRNIVSSRTHIIRS